MEKEVAGPNQEASLQMPDGASQSLTNPTSNVEIQV